MSKWEINKIDGTETEWTKPVDLSESEVKVLLERLVCMDLCKDEIISASTKDDCSLLEVRQNKGAKKVSFTCGENPHYIAVSCD